MDLQLDKLERYIQIIKDNSRKLNEIKEAGETEFINNYKNYNTALRLLQISIEAMIDIGNHIIARRSFGNPQDYADIFKILMKNSIIDQAEFEKFSQMAKFRNRIVHIYWEIDLKEVYQILVNNLNDFMLFIEKIRVYLYK